MSYNSCICILQISYKLYHHVKRWISAGQVYFSVLWCQQHLWMKTVLGTTIHKIKEQSVHHHINLFKNSSTKNQQFPPSYLGMATELLWPSPPKLPAVPPRHWPTRVVLGAQALRLDLQNEATNDEHQDCKCLTPEPKFLDGKHAHQKLRTHHGRFWVAGYHSLNLHTQKTKTKRSWIRFYPRSSAKIRWASLRLPWLPVLGALVALSWVRLPCPAQPHRCPNHPAGDETP